VAEIGGRQHREVAGVVIAGAALKIAAAALVSEQSLPPRDGGCPEEHVLETWEIPVHRSGSSKNPAFTWVTTATTGAEWSG